MKLYRYLSAIMIIALLASAVAGCAAPTPKVVEKVITRVIKETVVETVMVEGTPQVIEKEVEVEREVVVTATPEPKGGEITYGLTLVVSGIDPHRDASSELGIFLTSVYDPLVWRDQQGTFYPGLAAGWEISDDGLAYTFHLRDDVTFHDGEPFNAEAVKANFDRIVDPELGSRKARYMMGTYDHTEVVDDTTAVVHFSAPYAPFLDSISQVYLSMASPKAFSEWGFEHYVEHQVGTGPFMIEDYVAKDSIILIKNPDYNWAPEFMQHQGPAYLDKITFRFYPDAATRVPALESGEAQIMGEIPAIEANRLMSDARFSIYPVDIPGQSLQFFMNASKSPTDDPVVRRALLYGCDREAIANGIFRGFSPVAHGPLGHTTPYYYDGIADMYPYDLEMAKSLLGDAGWVDSDGDGIRDKDGEKLSLTTVLMDWGNMPEVGTAMQGLYRQLGVEVVAEILSYPAALEAARNSEHNLIPMAISSTDPDILSSYFHSRNIEMGMASFSQYPNEQLDAWLDEGAAVADEAERAAIYADAQSLIMEEALIIPIRDYVNLNGASSSVRGLRYSLVGWFPWLYDVYIE